VKPGDKVIIANGTRGILLRVDGNIATVRDSQREHLDLLVGLDEIRPEVITDRDPGDEHEGGAA